MEFIRSKEFAAMPSRLQAIFAANTIEEAIAFGRRITPIPPHPFNIIEIVADKFYNLDSSWTDMASFTNDLNDYRAYWHGFILNHMPTSGARCTPRLEVLITLPARTGKIVASVDPQA